VVIKPFDLEAAFTVGRLMIGTIFAKSGSWCNTEKSSQSTHIVSVCRVVNNGDTAYRLIIGAMSLYVAWL